MPGPASRIFCGGRPARHGGTTRFASARPLGMIEPVVCVVTKELGKKGLVIRQPVHCPFGQITSDQILRNVHLFDRRRAQARLREKRREIEVRFESEVQSQRRDRALELGRNRDCR